MNNKRSSNIELFRILCMLMILMGHFTIFSGISEIKTVNKVIIMYSYWGGMAGNVGFIAISAYFLDRYQFRIEKVLRLFSKTTIYSLVWLVVAIEVFHYSLNSADILRAVCPTFYGAYEYAHVFLLIQFVSPFIRRALTQASKQGLRKLLIVFGTLFMFLPYVMLESLNYMNLFMEFLYVYALVWYLKHYEEHLIQNTKKMFGIFCGNIMLMVLFSIFCLWGRRFLPLLTEYSSYWAKCGSIFITIAMVSLFFCFLTIEIPYRKWINVLASTTFGVYILHAPSSARENMYVDYLHTNTWGMSYSFIIKLLLWVVVVFLVCAVIDLVFSYFFRVIENVLKGVGKDKRKSINEWMNME